MKDTITVQCVYCKDRRTLSHYEAINLKEPPLCEKDGGPMVAIAATRRHKGK